MPWLVPHGYQRQPDGAESTGGNPQCPRPPRWAPLPGGTRTQVLTQEVRRERERGASPQVSLMDMYTQPPKPDHFLGKETGN